MLLFQFLEEIVKASAEGVRPPERLTVSQAAARYRVLNNPGAYVGPWLNETTPYLVEPMDVLTSEDYTGMVFCGPAQAGKTDMALNWVTHTVTCDPMDMMLVEPAQHRARDFSMRRLTRLHEHSPEVGRRLLADRDSDNTFDKLYVSGMLLTLGWPTKNHLSGKPIPRIWFSDYDRMDQNVEGDGEPFDLGQTRTTTFRSLGMTVAESSPSLPVTDPKASPRTPHEAPSAPGILSLYNRGDRRRWQWRCVECKNTFEPDFHLLKWPNSEDFLESAERAYLACPHCNAKYEHEGGVLPGKHEMNRTARWVKEGEIWLPDGSMGGTPARSEIASFWLKGVAATFSDFKTLVFKFLNAEKAYEETGSEDALRTTVNTNQGLPYIPKAQAALRSAEDLKGRPTTHQLGTVPDGVRFLVAAIDLQKNRFEVQVMGYGPIEGTALDCWVIDRFAIKKSRRFDEDGDKAWVNLGTHAEDWKQLTDEVILKTYPLADGSGRHMAIKLVVSDSAGREKFTENAYNFVRWLRAGPSEDEDTETYHWEPGLAARFQLLRGDPNLNAPRTRITFPDSERKDRFAGARGEIAVYAVNGNMLKDSIDKMLDRKEPGGRVVFPLGLPNNFFTELTVEVKDDKGRWVNPKRYRNESWDLLVYGKAATLFSTINAERIDWADPPGWAKPWDKNDLVFDPQISNKPFEAKVDAAKIDMAKLAEVLG